MIKLFHAERHSISYESVFKVTSLIANMCMKSYKKDIHHVYPMKHFDLALYFLIKSYMYDSVSLAQAT